MSKIAALIQSNVAGPLTPLLRGLSSAQFRQLLDSDGLPVADEETALTLALLFIQERCDPAFAREFGGVLAPKEVDEVLLAVRWRLVPGPIIAERVMAHPSVLDDDGQVRPRLLCALADGMRFQFLGGKAWSTMTSSRADRLRRDHRIPIKSYSSLAAGMVVRVLDDVSRLRQLCKRCPPGARRSVDWAPDMKAMAGSTYKVQEVDDDFCSAELLLNGQPFHVPFDALQLACNRAPPSPPTAVEGGRRASR